MITKFKNSPVIPVLTLDDKTISLKIADILITNGFTNLEITLRTTNALSCIEAIVKNFPEANVGAGTVTQVEQFMQIKNAGAQFAVSPGFTENLVKTAKDENISYLPGASTPSEIIRLKELGVNFQKFFHAKNSGGSDMIKAYQSVFPDITFCPTGGLSQHNFVDYLQLGNVACVGGSWLIDASNINYQQIEHNIGLTINSLAAFNSK